MAAQPPASSGLDPEDPIGVRYPNTARIWNYQLGGKDNFAVDRQASDAANAMVREMAVPGGADTALESRGSSVEPAGAAHETATRGRPSTRSDAGR